MARVKALRSDLVRAAGGAWRLDQGRTYEIADRAADALIAMGAVVRVAGEVDAPADGSEPEAVDDGSATAATAAAGTSNPDAQGAATPSRRRRQSRKQ